MLPTRDHEFFTKPFETKEGYFINKSFLHEAIEEGSFERVLQLIKSGHPVNLGLTSETEIELDGYSPLMAACHANRLDIAQLLYQQGADLFQVTQGGFNILFCLNSLECAQFLFEKMRKSPEKLAELLSHQSVLYKMTPIELFCREGFAEVALEFMKFPHFEIFIDVGYCLHYARLAYLKNVEERNELEKVCQTLRPFKIANSPLILEPSRTKMTLTSAHEELFQSIEIKRNTRENSIKAAIAQFYVLLSSPQDCIPYLKHLNDEFSRYYFEKQGEVFPKISSHYEFAVIDGLYYPIPQRNYSGITKDRALQEYLILLQRKYGLATHASKWIGYVREPVAPLLIQRGDNFTEDRFGNGLFHNKLTHTLQTALLLCAIENGEVDLSCEDNLTSPITPKNLIEYMANHYVEDKNNLFSVVRDRRALHLITFYDPLRLGSFIMYEGKKYGLECLSDYMIDSFCKGYARFLEAINLQTPHQSDISPMQFKDMMNDLDLSAFYRIKYLFNYALQREIKKGVNIPHCKKNKYAVIEKHYHPHPNFKLQGFFSTANRSTHPSEDCALKFSR